MPERAREIGDLLNQIVSTLRLDMGRHSAEFGLSRFEWAALRHLYYDKLRGIRSSTVESLGERTEMQGGALRDVIDGLVGRHYVESVWGQGFRLTPEGARVIEPLVSIAESIMLKATSGLTRDEMERLRDMLGRVADNLGAPRTYVEYEDEDADADAV